MEKKMNPVLVKVIFMALCSNVLILRTKAAVPVYGYSGVTTTVTSGHALHYVINLQQCKQINGEDKPEFVDTFGGQTLTYRTLNDHEVPGTPFIVFHDQRIAQSENEGKLVRLTRTIKVYHNDSAEVTSLVFTGDWSKLTSMYTHECTLSVPDNVGDIEFQASSSNVTHLLSFEKIVEALEMGHSVHMNAMSFLCPGGIESSFSTFGGHIQGYEIKTEGDNVGVLKADLQSVVVVLQPGSTPVLDVLHVRFHSNHSVQIVDTRTAPPSLKKIEEYTYFCELNFGPPGGTVEVFANN